MTQPRALVVRGGWDGHQPVQTSDRFAAFLRRQGFAVVVSDTVDSYADVGLMDSLSLIVQNWTMGSLNDAAWRGLDAAVRRGVGMAGWHGGLCDSFRGHVDYQWMTGGQFLSHPGGIIDYKVHITDWEDPVTRGLSDFTMHSEQYYMLVEPSNRVLATTTFDGTHDDLRTGTVMPVVWKRRWGKGRIFYSALGHVDQDFEVPEARTIMERGLLWSAASITASTANSA